MAKSSRSQRLKGFRLINMACCPSSVASCAKLRHTAVMGEMAFLAWLASATMRKLQMKANVASQKGEKEENVKQIINKACKPVKNEGISHIFKTFSYHFHTISAISKPSSPLIGKEVGA